MLLALTGALVGYITYRLLFRRLLTGRQGAASRMEGNSLLLFFGYAAAAWDLAAQTLELITPVALDAGSRFAIREGGRTVGAGVITKIIA